MILPCRFSETDIPPLPNGKRVVRCDRCGFQTKPTGSKLHKIHAECKAWPEAWEIGRWASLLLAVFGINQERFNWLRFKLGFTTKCGCDGRIETLDASGGWLRDRIDVIKRLTARTLQLPKTFPRNKSPPHQTTVAKESS